MIDASPSPDAAAGCIPDPPPFNGLPETDVTVRLVVYRVCSSGHQEAISHAWITDAAHYVRAWYSRDGYIAGPEVGGALGALTLTGHEVTTTIRTMLIRLTPTRTMASMSPMGRQWSRPEQGIRHMATTYSINLTDSEQAPAWMALCVKATPGAQDSGRVRYTVTTEQPEALEAALDADDDVIEYDAIGKDDVRSWETVVTYVSTYPDGDSDGACDVEVQIGEAGGAWYLHTRDDAGGSDEAGDTAYTTEDDARAAAEAYADERHEAQTGEDAESYLARKLSERAGEPDPEGEWGCYWSTVGDGSEIRERYESREQAEAAVEIANEQLHAANPGGQLLCGYEVRCLVDGRWVEPEQE